MNHSGHFEDQLTTKNHGYVKRRGLFAESETNHGQGTETTHDMTFRTSPVTFVGPLYTGTSRFMSHCVTFGFAYGTLFRPLIAEFSSTRNIGHKRRSAFLDFYHLDKLIPPFQKLEVTLKLTTPDFHMWKPRSETLTARLTVTDATLHIMQFEPNAVFAKAIEIEMAKGPLLYHFEQWCPRVYIIPSNSSSWSSPDFSNQLMPLKVYAVFVVQTAERGDFYK